MLHSPGTDADGIRPGASITRSAWYSSGSDLPIVSFLRSQNDRILKIYALTSPENRRGDHATGSRKNSRAGAAAQVNESATCTRAGTAAQVQGPERWEKIPQSDPQRTADNSPRERTTAPDPEGILQPEILTRPGTRSREDPTAGHSPGSGFQTKSSPRHAHGKARTVFYLETISFDLIISRTRSKCHAIRSHSRVDIRKRAGILKHQRCGSAPIGSTRGGALQIHTREIMQLSW